MVTHPDAYVVRDFAYHRAIGLVASSAADMGDPLLGLRAFPSRPLEVVAEGNDEGASLCSEGD